jgi:predicted GH43/DUF377 family glycosyl hydrolase
LVGNKDKEKMTEEPPRLKHNRHLCAVSMNYFKIHSRYPRVSEQVELMPLEIGKLKPFGYNPSIIEHNGKMLLVYRYHEGGKDTKLAYAVIGDQGHVLSHTLLPSSGKSMEDPKLFLDNGVIHISWVESTFPNPPFKSVVSYSELGEKLDPITLSLPRNDWSSMQKNWVFWTRGDEWLVLYQCQPKQIIFSATLEPNEIARTFEAPGPRWPWGQIKGGTPPVEYEGKLLRFFHSTLDNELDPLARRRYYVGAYLMDPNTFVVLRVSKKPIIYGSEVSEVRPKVCAHFKKNVVFPGGVIARDGHWLLSIGINDSQCAIAKITEDMLNL